MVRKKNIGFKWLENYWPLSRIVTKLDFLIKLFFKIKTKIDIFYVVEKHFKNHLSVVKILILCFETFESNCFNFRIGFFEYNSKIIHQNI